MFVLIFMISVYVLFAMTFMQTNFAKKTIIPVINRPTNSGFAYLAGVIKSINVDNGVPNKVVLLGAKEI